MRIRFFKIDGFIRIHHRTRYLTLLGSEKYDARYLISQKSDITYFSKIKVDPYDFLPIEKRLTLYNVTIHIKSVLYKDKNHYYYKVFSEKYSCQLARK